MKEGRKQPCSKHARRRCTRRGDAHRGHARLDGEGAPPSGVSAIAILHWLVFAFAVAHIAWVPATLAQPVENRLSVAPALMRGEKTTSAGLRWSMRRAFGGRFTHDRFPRRFQADAITTGAVAIHPEANPEVLRASLAAGWFVALFEPPIDPDPIDPDTPPKGGFDYGSISSGFTAGFESDQRFEEVNAILGVRLSYVNSRQDFPWPFVPALRLQAGAALPLADSAPGRVEAHARGDVYAAWHIPVFTTPVRLHGELWFWHTFEAGEPYSGAQPGSGTGEGTAPDETSARSFDGLFASLGLAYGLGTPIGDLTLHDVFLRWASGESPLRAADRKAWMIGFVVGR